MDSRRNVRRQGDVAQMVERSLSMREVRGSIPRISIYNFSQIVSERDLQTHQNNFKGTRCINISR
jgi:hypothetical protein